MRYTSEGNRFSHEVARGYQDRPRVPGPIKQAKKPRSRLECFGWGFLYAVITAVPITFILVTRG